MSASGIGDGLAELRRRYGLDAEAGARLGALLSLVASDPHAPTTVRDPLGVLNDHIADSLVALDLRRRFLRQRHVRPE